MSEDKNFESKLAPKSCFPRNGDKPFIQSADCIQNADISHFSDSNDSSHFSHFRHYCMNVSFKAGADLMVERALNDDNSSIDLLTFPIIFCYRHYIELSLKFLIVQYGNDADAQSELNTHHLSRLWGKVNDVIKEYDIEDINNSVPAVTEIIEDFQNLDPGSISFRYSVSKNGKRIKLKHEVFDLDNLADVMCRFENYIALLDDSIRNQMSCDSENRL